MCCKTNGLKHGSPCSIHHSASGRKKRGALNLLESQTSGLTKLKLQHTVALILGFGVTGISELFRHHRIHLVQPLVPKAKAGHHMPSPAEGSAWILQQAWDTGQSASQVQPIRLSGQGASSREPRAEQGPGKGIAGHLGLQLARRHQKILCHEDIAKRQPPIRQQENPHDSTTLILRSQISSLQNFEKINHVIYNTQSVVFSYGIPNRLIH